MKVVASKRDVQGTGASRRLRRQDKVPGILYGAGAEPLNIAVDHNPLFHSLRKEKFHASILDMEIEGRSERVLLRDFQMHPYRQIVLHVDFQRVDDKQRLHMRVPLHFTGAENSPAVKLSAAILSHVRSEVEVSCLPRDLPEFISVDLSGLTPQQNVHLSDIQLPQGVTLARRGKEDPVIVTVSIPAAAQEEANAAKEEVAAPAAAGAKAAAPAAAGAKAPAGKAPAAAAPAAKPAAAPKKK
jgi:large subunit ribosomal protein L25